MFAGACTIYWALKTAVNRRRANRHMNADVRVGGSRGVTPWRRSPAARTTNRRTHAAMLLMTCLTTIGPGAAVSAAPGDTARTAQFTVIGDTIPTPLDGAIGDAARGRELVVARDSANCILCHAVSDNAVRFAGNVGPSLDGAGRRLSVAQLRLRVADSQRLDAKTIMPSYYRVDGLDRVAQAYRGKPILDAQQVEDIVAWLASLQ
jgi:sulfur-oxidizing protein SoxX